MAANHSPQAVVFDLDGTLLDSLPLVLEAITHALAPFGSRPTMEIFAQLGGPPKRFMMDLLQHPHDLPVALARMEAYHHTHSHLIRPFTGAVELLGSLREAGVKLAVWTGRDRRSAERLLASHGLEDVFSTTLCGDDLDTHKPDPAGLCEILRRLEVTPPQTLFVGDADVDVLGGKAAGVETILIQHGRLIEERVAAQAWRLVPTAEAAYATVMEQLGPRFAGPSR
jgi:HAD superfamily hydrolase (TIGR01509 family)